MFDFPILAASDTAATSVMDALPHLAGMVMVMCTLTILWGVCAMIAKIVQRLVPEPKPAAPLAKPIAQLTPPPQQAARQPLVPDGIPPEIVAAIAAAVATITNQPYRIISIKPMSSSWERAGRHSVITSHRIR